MRITNYTLRTEKCAGSLRLALVADLHSRNPVPVVRAVKKIDPDIICIAGDLTEALDGSMDVKNQNGFAALLELCRIAPVYYAPGNHEIGASHRRMKMRPAPQPGQEHITPENRARIDATGARFVENTFALWNGIAIGGLGSGMLEPRGVPPLDKLDGFFAREGFKILICHHPEYFDKYLRDRDVDLVLSGHAHGGQWWLFGKGVYAPDQGLFPKYTSGMHEGRLIISRGTANTARPIPRFFNPREVLCIQIQGKEE